MTSIEAGVKPSSLDELCDQNDFFQSLEGELEQALTQYLQMAHGLLDGSGINQTEVPASFFSLKRNFFSALFLFSYHRAGIDKERRLFYAVINQCLRGMVTGCDNLLDNEYKETLPTDLPETATRFRSVLDIMVSDRVLFELALKATASGRLTWEQAGQISAISLKALLLSGVQEAGEETGVNRILPPEQILSSVHHYKTGLLFQAPWAIPERLENISYQQLEEIKTALYNIGMGCQLMDDMVDLEMDIRSHRHNYVLSLLCHRLDSKAQQGMEEFLTSGEQVGEHRALLSLFPEIRCEVLKTALAFLETGLRLLFTEHYERFVEPAILFLSQRIGVSLA